MGADVLKLKTAKTVQSQEIKIDASKWHLHEDVKVNDANVVKTNIVADNGLIQISDRIILPK